MSKIIIAFIAVLVLIGGYLLYSNSQKSLETQNNSVGTVQNKSELGSIAGYQGKVIAGSTSPFLEFTKADYDKAKAEGKIIFLDFYANWCPVCRAEAPIIATGFDGLQSGKVVGFRVNFNDDETDEAEKNLAKQFNIAYQYTKIILKDGKEVSRSGEKWEKADFESAFSKVL